MTAQLWECQSCFRTGAGVPTQCDTCGSRELRFEQVTLGQRCDACGEPVDEGWRDADLCECGKQLCRRCLAAHERHPQLCAGRRCA